MVDALEILLGMFGDDPEMPALIAQARKDGDREERQYKRRVAHSAQEGFRAGGLT